MVRTGKSGRYRYYACASHRLKGSAACSNPVAIREQQLDDMVLTALGGSVDNARTAASASLRSAQAPRTTSSGNVQRRAALRNASKDLEQQIDRLYGALREGTVTDSRSFRAQLFPKSSASARKP